MVLRIMTAMLAVTVKIVFCLETASGAPRFQCYAHSLSVHLMCGQCWSTWGSNVNSRIEYSGNVLFSISYVYNTSFFNHDKVALLKMLQADGCVLRKFIHLRKKLLYKRADKICLTCTVLHDMYRPSK